MRTWKRVLIIVLVLMAVLLAVGVVAALAAPAAPAAPTAFGIDWQVLASGGATMSSSSYRMLSTAGQPIVGESSSASYGIASGYWVAFRDFVRTLFLPLILKQ